MVRERERARARVRGVNMRDNTWGAVKGWRGEGGKRSDRVKSKVGVRLGEKSHSVSIYLFVFPYL